LGLGFREKCLGLKDQGLIFSVQGCGFEGLRIEGWGFKVEGSRFIEFAV
jgi:hypothetical protein